MIIETVEIENPDAPGERMIINKSDFNPEIHKPFETPAPAGDDPKAEGGSAPKPEGKAKK
jgi:hypothetical protein